MKLFAGSKTTANVGQTAGGLFGLAVIAWGFFRKAKPEMIPWAPEDDLKMGGILIAILGAIPYTSRWLAFMKDPGKRNKRIQRGN